jgi:putative transposase
MAWNRVNVETQRKLFIILYFEENISIAELCRQFNISRPTGYKWIDRYNQMGVEGLIDKSKAPLVQAKETPKNLVNEILKVKFQYSNWGPKKIKGFLESKMAGPPWPSKTTIGNIFRRNGLIVPRKLRRRYAEKTDPLSHCNQSNDIWCIDFKGWFMTRDKKKCEPFTVTDAYSRYLFSCVQLNENNADHVWAIFDMLFREYGLPKYVRSDNGPPFASRGVGRLTSLSVRLIKAGVTPEWIEPGKPQQNGRHERMHLTLKQEGVLPHELTLAEQQVKFNEFIEYYNFIRPHEALDQKCPGEVYKPSPRQWSGRLRSPEYPDGYEVRKVRICGKMSWSGKDIFIGNALAGEPVGIKENHNGELMVYYGPLPLGKIKGQQLNFQRRKSRKKRKIPNKEEKLVNKTE